MVDVIKSLNFEYVASNPGSSFRGIHESIINYGGNKMPEFITCCHEESSIAMAQGYFKAEGKPMAVLCHGTVGLQHAAMAIYNAYCDRVPIYILGGNTLDATLRRPGVEWQHSVQDAAAMLRDFVKWDDQPVSLPHFAESAIRAYKIRDDAADDAGARDDRRRPAGGSDRPRDILAAPRAAASRSPRRRRAIRAPWPRPRACSSTHRTPVIIADRAARTPAGITHLIELAETLQAPVIDQGGRMNFPSRHPLNQSDAGRRLVTNADVILGLELTDFWGQTNASRDSLVRTSRSILKPGTKLISITATDLFSKANFQDFQRYPEVDVAMAADAEATLPALTEACKKLLTADRTRVMKERGAKFAEANAQGAADARTKSVLRVGRVPISTARLTAELWAQIKDRTGRSCRKAATAAAGHPAVEFRQALSAPRRMPAAPVSATAHQPQSAARWPTANTDAVGRDPGRRRLHVCARRLVDGRASQDSAARGDAQQPRVPSGGHAHPAHGRTAISAASRTRTSARR
jgi:thiamine pyrophosphate-dependent acetolactate synthase large subunit-like protein